MRPLRGLSWGGTAYHAAVIVVGAALVPSSLLLFPSGIRDHLLALAYLGLFTQLAALMPIRWRRGKQTVDTMPLIAASLLAPGFGPALLSWLCKFDGRWPSADQPMWQLLFNRAKSAIEFGLPSMAIAALPIPSDVDVPIKTVLLAAGTLFVGYPLTAKGFALYEHERFWRVLTSNIGLNSVRSLLILCVGGGALYMVLQRPGGYVMGFGLLGLLFAVRSNMADAQRQHIERIQTLELMAQALDARDPMTELHSQRVSNLAAQIAQALGMPNLEVEQMRVAGLLHDIGKIGVPDSVLKKPTSLDPHEWIAMKRHAEVGADMIASHSALQPIAPWVRYHHERWNGSGYPSGVVGTDIPLGARVLAVADSFDTITGPRIYRPTSMSALEAVADISAQAGELYDPIVVNAMRQVFDVGPLPVTEASSSGAGALDSSGALELLRTNARLRALGAGMTVSAMGDPLTAVAVTVSAFAVTRNGLGVGAALVLRAAAMMLTGTLLGGAVDRLPRRRLVVGADVAQFATLIATPVLLRIAPWTLFIVVVVLGAATALSQAGRDASIAQVVQSPQIGSANSLVATGTTTARAIGYPLAAVLIWTASSTTPLYLADAVTFVVAAGLTLLAGPLGGGIRSRSYTGAFRSSFRLRGVRTPLVVAGVGAFILSMTAPAVIVLAYQLSPNGAKTYTVLEVVLTAGMIAGAMAFASFARKARMAVLVGLLLMGGLSIAAAASSYLTITAGLLFIASIGNQLYFIGNRTELQQLAPPERVGSVMATRGVLAQTLAILGSAAGGLLTTALGGRLTYGVVGVGLALVAVVLAVVSRANQPAGNGEAIPAEARDQTRMTRSPKVEIAETA